MKKFLESLDTAIITSRFVFKNNSPILSVYHYFEDGMWQFNGSEFIEDDNDYLVISLEEILAHDNSLLELADLPLGYEAHRKDIDAEWEIYASYKPF